MELVMDICFTAGAIAAIIMIGWWIFGCIKSKAEDEIELYLGRDDEYDSE